MGHVGTRALFGALAAAAAGAVLVVGLSWQESARQARAEEARRSLARLDALGACLSDADAARCAYVTRGEPAERERFAAAVSAARSGLDWFEARVAARVAEKLRLLEESVRLRGRVRFGDRRQAELSRLAREQDRALRQELAALRGPLDEELAGQPEGAWSASSWCGYAGVGSLLAVLLVGVAGFATVRGLSAERRTATEQLASVQAALGRLSELQGRLEEQFRRAQRLASLGRVTSEVVHDFNNLLGVILNCSELTLLQMPEGAPARQLLTQAVEAGHRAADLTRRVLSVGRERPQAPGPMSLNNAVRALEPIIRRVVGLDVEARLELEEALPPVVAAPGLLDQMLLNLAANARDAMPKGGELVIRTRDAGDGRAELSVSDTGRGMDAQTRARMFDAFFSTKGEGGNGLGAAIILDAARRCGGTVEVDSEVGVGTCVRVYLPLATEMAGPPPAPGRASPVR